MTLDVALAGTQRLRVRLFAESGQLEVDGWDLYERDQPIEPGPELERWVEREFTEHGAEAFGVGAMYRALGETEP